MEFLSIFQSLGSGLSDTAGALVAFFATITDYTLWRSLGWLALGILLIGAGIAFLAKSSIPGVREL